MSIIIIALAACLVLCAMPPDALEHLRRIAPDAVRIEVTKVTQQLDVADASRGGVRWVQVEVHANVLAVMRSKHGLKAGDAIVIRWTLHSPRNRAVGDFPTMVEVDAVYDASLNLDGDGKAYIPAANSMSFIPLPVRERS